MSPNSYSHSTQLVMRDALRVPGLLSLSRVPLGLTFAFVWTRPSLAIGVLATAATTDVLDGWWARRSGQTTETGAALDPLMDKAFALLVVGTLLGARAVTPLEAALLATRDMLELPLVAYTFTRRIRTSQCATLPGKMTTVLQFASVLAVLVGSHHRHAVIGATAVVGLIAGGSYWARAIRLARPLAA